MQSLIAGSFLHDVGKIFTPKLDIVGWAAKAEFDGVLEAAAADAEADRKADAELDDTPAPKAKAKASG